MTDVKYALVFDFQLTKEEELLVAQLMTNERLYNAIVARIAKNEREACLDLVETMGKAMAVEGGDVPIECHIVAEAIRARTSYQEKVALLGPVVQWIDG